MGISERKKREKEEMRAKILLSARKLFIRDGYENVTIRKIADNIEYSPTTIYLYFKDKDEIFFQLYKDAFEEFYRYQLQSQKIEDPVERLKAHGVAYVKFALENPEYYDLMFISTIPMKPVECDGENQPPARKTYELLLSNVEDCIKSGYFKQGSPHSIALFLWGSVHGLASLYLKKRMIQFPEEMRLSLLNEAISLII